MRLKTYICPSMEEALAQIRRDLGDEAVIISNVQEGKSVRVTAASDQAPQVPAPPKVIENKYTRDQVFQYFANLLRFHHYPEEWQEDILQNIAQGSESLIEKGPTSVMGALYKFSDKSVDQLTESVLLLAGPAGAGKTITLAKIAAEMVMQKRPVRLVTVDGHKAGAVEQILKYSNALKVDAHVAHNAQELAKYMGQKNKGEILLVDTPGINPFNKNDINQTAEYIFALKQAPVMVLPAGADPYETYDQVEAFKELGINRFLMTRTDTVRRLGSLLVVMFKNNLELMGVSGGPTLGHRLLHPSAQKILNLLSKDVLPIQGIAGATLCSAAPEQPQNITKVPVSGPHSGAQTTANKTIKQPSPQPTPWIQLLQEKRS